MFDHWPIIAALFALGSLGGLIHSVRTSKSILLPSRSPGGFHLGIIGDMLIGSVGGVVIFIITPGDSIPLESGVNAKAVIEFFGFALLGGYGAPYFLDRAVGNTLADMKQGMEQQQRVIDGYKEQVLLDQDALQKVDLQLSDTVRAYPPKEELIDAIIKSSSMVKHNIRHQAAVKRRIQGG